LEGEIRSVKGVVDVHDLHIWSITPGNVILTAHVVVSDVSACNDILGDIKRIAGSHGINHITVQIEREGFLCPPSCPILREGDIHRHH